MEWRKSTYSTGSGGACVETATDHGVILVRDTVNREGATIQFSASAWETFLGTLR
jgi:Domain of unknown function (DUF397)